MQVLHNHQKLISNYQVSFIRWNAQQITLNHSPTKCFVEDLCLSAPDLDIDRYQGKENWLPFCYCQHGRIIEDDLEKLELLLVNDMRIVMVIYEVFEEKMDVLIHVLLLQLLQSHVQCLVDP